MSEQDQAPPTKVVHARDVSRELAPGTRIDRYEIVGTLGSGGCGVVYAARHVHLDKTVALKLLHRNLVQSEEAVERFFREARAAAAVGNPHIVRVLDCGTSMNGQPFLAMEFLKGVTLSSLLEGGNRLEVDRAVAIAVQTLDGLAAAMEAGIVHRDLKPGNIFLTRDPDSGADFVKILDFGVSKVHQSAYEKALTGTGALLGTPRYMAPEQFKGAHDVDHRADLFAASVVLFQMLAGQLPFKGETPIEIAHRATVDPPLDLHELAPDVPVELCNVIYRGLEKLPEDRWQDAQSYAEVILSSVGHTTRIDLSEIEPQDDAALKTVQDIPINADALLALDAESSAAAAGDSVSDTEDEGPSDYRTLPGMMSPDRSIGLAPGLVVVPTVKEKRIPSADNGRDAPAGASGPLAGSLDVPAVAEVLELFAAVPSEGFTETDEVETTVPRAQTPVVPGDVAPAPPEAAPRSVWAAPPGAPREPATGPGVRERWPSGPAAQPGAPAPEPRPQPEPRLQPKTPGSSDSLVPARPRWVFWLVFALLVALGGLLFGTVVGLGVVASGWLG
jgi:serine/threonine-protein kinase